MSRPPSSTTCFLRSLRFKLRRSIRPLWTTSEEASLRSERLSPWTFSQVSLKGKLRSQLILLPRPCPPPSPHPFLLLLHHFLSISPPPDDHSLIHSNADHLFSSLCYSLLPLTKKKPSYRLATQPVYLYAMASALVATLTVWLIKNDSTIETVPGKADGKLDNAAQPTVIAE